MESLSDTPWDVVLSGTGLSQSLLALAFSRSGKKVLHVDKNDFYGGAEAALSLQEAEAWAEATKEATSIGPFRFASITKAEPYSRQDGDAPQLEFSRSYSLSLAPQLIYTRSNLLPVLVSSKVYRQLEFLAVGSWWLYADAEARSQAGGDEGTTQRSEGQVGSLHKIPGSREDIFADKSIDLRSARSLMKFLKFVSDTETHPEILSEWGLKPFPEFLTSQYKILPDLQAPLLALTLSPDIPAETTTALALPRIHRHLTSVGMFGPGFGAVIPKWGGLAEVAQVACRAGAVGGGVYVLKRGIKAIGEAEEPPTPDATNEGQASTPTVSVELEDSETVNAKWVAGTFDHLPELPHIQAAEGHGSIQRSITIVSSPLLELFSLPVEGGPPPAATVVVFPTGSLGAPDLPPVYLMIHNSDTGECPPGQCIMYAHTKSVNPKTAMNNLLNATSALLAGVDESPKPEKLWCMHYRQILPTPHLPSEGLPNERVLRMPALPPDLALEEEVLKSVRAVWERIVGEDGDGDGDGGRIGRGFMTFEDREGAEVDGEGEGGDE